MRDIYIGSQRVKKNGVRWKLYLFLFSFMVILGGALKVSTPWIVEKWLNNHGMGNSGYAYTVREVELALREGEVTLKDVKVFHPESKVEMIETPSLKLKMDLRNLLKPSDRKVKMSAQQIAIFLSKDLSSEIKRIKNSEFTIAWSLSLIEGEFGKVSIIEKKENQSRTQMELFDANFNMKNLSLLALNNKTEFSLSSKLVDGGEFLLSGKIKEKDGQNLWSIKGNLKNFTPELFNKVAGSELPFSFDETTLSAEIIAESRNGEIKGEIIPEVTRLNLITERVGLPKQVIARALSEELSFTLPFRLKDQFIFEYEDTYKKLKEYRKYPLRVSLKTYSQQRMN